MANDYEVKNLNNLGQLKKLATRAKSELDAIKTVANGAIRSGELVDHVAKFYTSANKTGTPAFTMDIPEEMFLDQAKTKFVGNFAWSAETYPGSTNPNLDGKPVFVLAVKGEDASANPTFSFLDMSKLVDTYTAADTSVTISGYTVKVNISADAGNAIVLKADGLYVAHQDISGKADKVASATNGDLAGLDASGNLTDSGVAAADVVTKIATPTADNLVAQDANGKIADAGIAKGDVVTKVTGGTENHVVLLDANGKIKDSGAGIATDAEVDAMLDEVFGSAE